LIGLQHFRLQDVNTFPGPVAITHGDLVDGIHDVHALYDSAKRGVGTIQVIGAGIGHHNEEFIGGGQFVRIVRFATGHGNGTSVVFVAFFRIGRKQVPPYIGPFFCGPSVIGIAPLDDEILYDPMELGAVKIVLSGQIDEIGLVVGHIVVQFKGETAHVRSEPYLVLFEFFLIIEKEVNGILLCQYKSLFFFRFFR